MSQTSKCGCRGSGETWKNLPSGIMDKRPSGRSFCWCPKGVQLEKEHELKKLLGVKNA